MSLCGPVTCPPALGIVWCWNISAAILMQTIAAKSGWHLTRVKVGAIGPWFHYAQNTQIIDEIKYFYSKVFNQNGYNVSYTSLSLTCYLLRPMQICPRVCFDWLVVQWCFPRVWTLKQLPYETRASWAWQQKANMWEDYHLYFMNYFSEYIHSAFLVTKCINCSNQDTVRGGSYVQGVPGAVVQK